MGKTLTARDGCNKAPVGTAYRMGGGQNEACPLHVHVWCLCGWNAVRTSGRSRRRCPECNRPPFRVTPVRHLLGEGS